MSRNVRPRINVPRTQMENVCDALCLFTLIGLGALTTLYWRALPEEVPTHFGLSGEADDWGPKSTIFIFPAIVTLTLLLTFAVQFIPQHLWNYPVKITQANAERQYALARRLLALIRVELCIMFVVLYWQILESAIGRHHVLGFQLAVWLSLSVMLGTIVFGVTKAHVYARQDDP